MAEDEPPPQKTEESPTGRGEGRGTGEERFSFFYSRGPPPLVLAWLNLRSRAANLDPVGGLKCRPASNFYFSGGEVLKA